jgi:hypothetical protein
MGEIINGGIVSQFREMVQFIFQENLKVPFCLFRAPVKRADLLDAPVDGKS